MKVKINEKMICIPPHISATWEQVTFLQSKENTENEKFTLHLHLSNGKLVEIPNLDSSIIDIAFSAHMRHLENTSTRQTQKTNSSSSQDQTRGADPKTFGHFLQHLTGLSPEQLSDMPIRFGVTKGIPGLENIEMAFQHNQEHANSPDMPADILEKISGMAKMMLGPELNAFPKPEPHCNCIHCQLGRMIHNTPKTTDLEPVSEEDLKFRTWDIKEEDDNNQMFIVSNPLDPKEHYTVYLGKPVGCTCGQADCEHIKAVLYS